MTGDTAEVVICGAGIAGVAAAYHLAVRRGVGGVVLVDERPPLSLTSDKSTECYRNWWPGPGDAMVAVMNRSIDLLEELARESDNAFRLNRRGYLFATADPDRVATLLGAAREAEALGAGPARVHRAGGGDYQPAAAAGFESPLTGADVVTDRAVIRRNFPYLAEDTVAVVHARRCGWFSGHELGMLLLERAREKGARLLEGRVEGFDTRGGRVAGVRVAAAGGSRTIATRRAVIAAGPFLRRMAALLDVDLPVHCERHAKVAFVDEALAMPRSAPMTIWADPLRVPWEDEEREGLADASAHRFLLGELPAGAHGRPEGEGDSRWVLGIWTYDVEPVEPEFPLAIDPWYPHVVLRGLARMIPAMGRYAARMPVFTVDGGYYTKTPENRFLASPLPAVDGAYALGALSGYGLMAANGAADLLADHVTGRPLPPYAAAFHVDRYRDPAYVRRLAEWGDTGQL